ncbi:MAG: 4Fe-4S dicluster domain-containing protein [Pseudomonadota bacterium]
MYYFLPYPKLQQLIDELNQQAYRCVGPQVRDGAIVYDHFHDIKQLPWGVRDIQNPGEYRLEAHDEKQAFAWANGPQAAKPELFKSRESLWRVERDDKGKLCFREVENNAKIALFGIRPCDLHAIKIQDRVFLQDKYVDQHYQRRRENTLIIVVNCSYSSNNCFCLTANGHPQAKSDYDIALTEVDGGFTADFLSSAAQALLSKLALTEASSQQLTAAEKKIDQAVTMQGKKMPEGDLAQLLRDNREHPQWEDVSRRCLSCGNCTQVCPTCFCHREVEKPALDGQSSEHVREWDSCFTEGHSYIHGLVVRKSTKHRYRQWLTHKLGTWHEQFGTSGCVGCGRCITWCPTGIDITKEVAALQKEQQHDDE